MKREFIIKVNGEVFGGSSYADVAIELYAMANAKNYDGYEVVMEDDKGNFIAIIDDYCPQCETEEYFIRCDGSEHFWECCRCGWNITIEE